MEEPMTETEQNKIYKSLCQEILDFYNMDTYEFTQKYGYAVSTTTICADIRKVLAGHKLNCTVVIVRKDPNTPERYETNCNCGAEHLRFLWL